MEEGKIKNTITRSFELQDYKIDGTELSGFWADLQSKEELVVEVNYSPEVKRPSVRKRQKILSGRYAGNVTVLRLNFQENIKCEVTFKNFEKKVYKTGQSDFEAGAQKKLEKPSGCLPFLC